jgi:hypothetical protein
MKIVINNILKSIGFVGCVTVLLTSCVKDTTNTTYSGPDLVEFANPNYIAPLAATTRTVTVPTTTAPKTDSMYIQLVGKLRSTPTNVNFVVDPSSTAIAVTDYTITTPSPVIIPANNSGVKVRVSFNKPSITKTLIINITDGDGVTPSENYKIFTYNIK